MAGCKCYVIGLFACCVVHTVSAEEMSRTTVTYGNIPGVDENLLSLDIYRPAREFDHCPVIVYVHGGGWCMGGKQGTHFKDEYFTDLGYVFVSLNYRLSPLPKRLDGTISLETNVEHAVRFPAQPQDVAKGLAWVYHHIPSYQGDPERIALIGHSAGAHLVSLVSTDETYLNAEQLDLSIIKGTVDLDAGSLNITARFPEIKKGNHFFYNCILSCYGDDERILTQASPTTYVTPGKAIPPFLLVHQQKNEERTRDHQRFHALLTQHGYRAKLVPVDFDHGQLNNYIGQVEAGAGDELAVEQQAEAKRLTKAVAQFFADCLAPEK